MKVMSLRLDESLQQSLDQFSELVGKPKNRLVNEAVRLFLEQKIPETERGLEATLEALKACRVRDPLFENAIDSFAEAEAANSGNDPLEGRIEEPSGSVSEEIKGLLHGGLG